MAAFSYNPYSSGSYENQYREYLQNQNYVNQIDNAIRQTGEMNAAVLAIQAREVQDAINVSSERQRESIIQASNAICSTLDSGFSDVNYNLEDIKGELGGLSNLVGHCFSLLVEGQKITHEYLGQIQNLLRLPDSQKERVYHIEEGMKYLYNAFRQGADSDFYKDAFDEFNQSKGGEEKDVKDFVTLYYIGLIHLKSLNPELLNLQKAERNFRSAARYYLAEHSVGGTNFSNNLLQSSNNFILGAAEAYLYAAEACYIQEKVSEAIELASEAWRILPELTKAGFMLSKYLAANDNVIEATRLLGQVIRTNRYLSTDVRPDFDLISKPEIINLLERLRVEAVQEAKVKYELCTEVIMLKSTATSYLESIDKLIKLDTFLEAKQATDLLLVPKTWTIMSGANISSQGRVIAKISSQEFTGSVIDFVKFERERVLALPKAKSLIRVEEIEMQKRIVQDKISSLQSNLDFAYSVFGEDWIMLGGGILIWALGLVVGLASSPAHNFITVLLVLLSYFVIYLGGAALVIATIAIVVMSIPKGLTIFSLKSEIMREEKTIWKMNRDIKKLR